MKANVSNTISEKYKELITYISNMGIKSEITYESQIEIYIKVYDYFKRELIWVKLFQPIDREWEYNYHRLRISWSFLPNKHLCHDHWFNEDTNQREIFDLLLLDIFEYKFQTINKETVDDSNTLIYMVLNDWLHNKKKSYSSNEHYKCHKYQFFKILKIRIYKFLKKIHFK